MPWPLARTQRKITPEQARKLLDDKPTWLVIIRSSDDKSPLALKAADLARALLDEQELDERGIDLLEIPGQRLELAPIHLQATLSEAFDRLNDYGVDALYVQHTTAPMIQKISGIITRSAIESYYRYKP